ncbi:MAG TPA: hypothetical protein VFA81_04055 [Burkholderiales bacterium]|nr:hypothetical protein [Burkholderiales bacterium]
MIRLTTAPSQYSFQNEASFRKQVEQEIQQIETQWQQGALAQTVNVNAQRAAGGSSLNFYGATAGVRDWQFNNPDSLNALRVNFNGNFIGQFQSNGGLLLTNYFQVGSNQVVGPQIGGYGTPTGGSRIANFPGASATLVQTSEMLAQLIADLKTHGLLGA